MSLSLPARNGNTMGVLWFAPSTEIGCFTNAADSRWTWPRKTNRKIPCESSSLFSLLSILFSLPSILLLVSHTSCFPSAFRRPFFLSQRQTFTFDKQSSSSYPERKRPTTVRKVSLWKSGSPWSFAFLVVGNGYPCPCSQVRSHRDNFRFRSTIRFAQHAPSSHATRCTRASFFVHLNYSDVPQVRKESLVSRVSVFILLIFANATRAFRSFKSKGRRAATKDTWSEWRPSSLEKG